MQAGAAPPCRLVGMLVAEAQGGESNAPLFRTFDAQWTSPTAAAASLPVTTAAQSRVAHTPAHPAATPSAPWVGHPFNYSGGGGHGSAAAGSVLHPGETEYDALDRTPRERWQDAGHVL